MIGVMDCLFALPTMTRLMSTSSLLNRRRWKFDADQIAASDLGLHVVRLASLHNMPHVEALAWRWAAAQKEWNTKEQQSEQS